MTAMTITTRSTGRAAQACALLLSLLLPWAANAAATGGPPIVVRVAAQEAIAPKWIVGAGGRRPAGICPDIFAAIERDEPRLRFSGLGAARSLTAIDAGLENGGLDAACALIPSPRRQAVALAVGKPVYMVRHRLAARIDDPVAVSTTADLVRLDALVTSHRSSVFTDKLKAAGVRVDDATDDNGLNLRKMLAGHGRFAYLNELTLRHYLRTAGLAGRVRILPAVLAEEPAYFWVSRKADPALARLMEGALDRLKANGELDRIYARWAANP
jgi:polar amino acid transport system substrate-binding protein